MGYQTETELLRRFLGEQRNHVLGILEGLAEEQLRRPVLPSGWHCLGMAKHLALADEHYWFRSVVGGESFGFLPEGPNPEWQLAPGESAEGRLRPVPAGDRARGRGDRRHPARHGASPA